MVFLTALSVAALAHAPQLAEAESERIPILVVSGANNHDWEWTTPSLASILNESGLFDVEVTYDPAKDLADRAKLDAVKAVVLDYNGKSWGDAAQTTFLAAVTDGLGVVVIHAADNSGVDWKEYEILVADLWREGTGHGRFHTFDVTIDDRDHPVTRTLPTILKHPDELYHNLVNVHGVERRVLANAFSSKESGGTGEDEPMIIVRSYGKGRIFHTPLGHVWRNSLPSQASHRDPQFRGLVARGTEWAATGTIRDARTAPAALSSDELKSGWISLMDASLWSAFGGGDVPAGWNFDGDLLVRTARAGDIVTRALYDDFELTFQWKTTVAGNSGIKYRIPRDAQQPIGPEYQLLDSSSAADNKMHRAGALYDVIPTGESPRIPWGEFHTSRLVVRGSSIEHWLDGVLVMSTDTSSPAWVAAVASSKFNGAPDFAASGPGRILVQDHGDEVWIRGMRIRPIAAANESDWTPVFPGNDLSSWSNVGDAVYAVEGGTLIGKAGPKRRQSFLVSSEIYGDFELEIDVKMAVTGNSGIQVRSHVNDKGRLYGYQAEIDPTPRSWSAGIYDEGRRGWLNDLSGNDAARAAFDMEGWNRYRIVCKGPHIRTWLNGVAAADLLDGEDLTGSLGFQIHGGDDDIEIHWRDARIRQSNDMYAWAPIEESGNDHRFGDSPGVRMTVEGDLSELWFSRQGESEASIVPLASHELWKKGQANRVTILRAGSRVVVQIGDRTAQDVTLEGSDTVTVYMPGAGPTVTDWFSCRRVRRY